MCVTVVIPIYNAAKYVKEAVNSALLQQEVSEILIVEDGSTDGSLEICKVLSANNKIVKLLNHRENRNLGPSVSRNLGIINATSPFIAFLDADDVYTSGRFKDTLKWFKDRQELKMVFEPAEMMDENLERKVGGLIFFKNLDFKRADFESYFMNLNGWTTLNATTFRKSAFQTLGLFDENLWQTQDTDLLLRAFLKLKYVGIDTGRVVAFARSHDGRRTYNTITSLKYKAMLYEKWYPIVIKGKFSKSFNRHFINVMLYYRHPSINQEDNGVLRKIKKIGFVSKYIVEDPRLISKLL